MIAEGNVSILPEDPKRAIRAMTGPLLVALLIVQVNALADRAWCSGPGADALSAVSLCTPLYEVINGLGTGLGIGAAGVVSRRPVTATGPRETPFRLFCSVLFSASSSHCSRFSCARICSFLSDQGTSPGCSTTT